MSSCSRRARPPLDEARALRARVRDPRARVPRACVAGAGAREAFEHPGAALSTGRANVPSVSGRGPSFASNGYLRRNCPDQPDRHGSGSVGDRKVELSQRFRHTEQGPVAALGVQFEIEKNEIPQMLEAQAAYRRRRGQKEISEDEFRAKSRGRAARKSQASGPTAGGRGSHPRL
jgi:hypothetical protein